MSDVAALCEGVSPLTGRLEQWQHRLLAEPQLISDLLDRHGSPVNLIDPSPMRRNAHDLADTAASEGLQLGIYFARKANKALALVDEALSLDLGIDVASEAELRQALERGAPADRIILTAAVKPAALLSLALESGTTISIDNEDELRLLKRLCRRSGRSATVALRVAPELGEDRIQTRFGLQAEEVVKLAGRFAQADELVISGLHFHLDGYSAADRICAISQCLDLIDQLSENGHTIDFLDIGGGIPISYLESERQWRSFWKRHTSESLTFGGHPLTNVYPYYQQPVRGTWLRGVLTAPVNEGIAVADALRRRGLQLRCEPGRSLLDGCGMTAARVEFRKQRRDGTWLIGVAMNRTQCRSTSDDFMVDPILVRADGGDGAPIEGFLVGAYCIERELLTLRRMRFPRGVQVGDIVVFPNTAGYLMHILESASHQIPLASNLILRDGDLEPDAIDAAAALI
jgi:diaminopimelate decarboxylase